MGSDGTQEPLTPLSIEHTTSEPCPHHAALQEQSLGLTQGLVEAVAEQLRHAAGAEASRDTSGPSNLSASAQAVEQLEELRTQYAAARGTAVGLRQQNARLTTQVLELQRQLDEKKAVLGQLMAQVEAEHSRGGTTPRFASALKQKATKLKA
eukprot:EG_transcript_35688